MSAASSIARNEGRWRDVLENVARELVSFKERPDGAYVDTPLLYPSGASVVVRVAGGPHRFLVSDFGAGYHEADMLGATLQFSRHARAVADGAGVKFDEHAFFVVEIDREQLAGAIVAIANCSQEAVTIASYKLAERGRSDAAELLYQRLIRVFPSGIIEREKEYRGSSTHPWNVTTLVTVGNRKAIFEPVSPVHVSVTTAAAKLNDIGQLEHPPALNVIVVNKENFGTWLPLLSQAANVIERSAPDETYLRTLRVA